MSLSVHSREFDELYGEFVEFIEGKFGLDGQELADCVDHLFGIMNDFGAVSYT